MRENRKTERSVVSCPPPPPTATTSIFIHFTCVSKIKFMLVSVKIDNLFAPVLPLKQILFVFVFVCLFLFAFISIHIKMCFTCTLIVLFSTCGNLHNSLIFPSFFGGGFYTQTAIIMYNILCVCPFIYNLMND